MLSTAALQRTLTALDAAFQALQKTALETPEYEIYRLAVIKAFELSLELSGKLLRKALKAYVSQAKEVDALTYKDVFRLAAKHQIVSVALVDRWFAYRDNRNTTAQDYGEKLAEETLTLLPAFLSDSQALITALENAFRSS